MQFKTEICIGTLRYILGPPSDRENRKVKTHVLLMDDLKMYTARKTKLEKIMKAVIVLLKSIRLTLGMDKCATLAVERGGGGGGQ